MSAMKVKTENIFQVLHGITTELISVSIASKSIEIKDQQSAQFQVDIAKSFIKVADKYIENKKNNNVIQNEEINHLYTSIFLSLPNHIISLILTSKAVHDSFHNAFETSLEILKYISNHLIVDKWKTSFILEIITICKSGIESIFDLSSASNVIQPIDLQRIDVLVGCISSIFFTCNHVYNLNELDNNELIEILIVPIIQLVTNLQSKMKIMVSDYNDNKVKQIDVNIIKKLEKDLKICRSICSTIRKSCITSVDNMLLICPQWIRDNYEEYWNLCINVLLTPLLFSVGYTALSNNNNNNIINKILSYLSSALKNIHRYSMNTATDVLSSIHALCVLNCSEMLSYDNFVLDMLNILTTLPRLPPSSSASIDLISDWKLMANNTLIDVLNLCANNKTNSTFIFSIDVTNEFIKISVKSIRSFYYNIGININSKLKENEENGDELYIDAEEVDEAITGLLQSNTVILNLFLETYTNQITMKKNLNVDNIIVNLVDKDHEDDNELDLTNLIELFNYIQKINNRKVFFDDDLLQLCSEMDFMAKCSIFLYMNLSNDNNYIITAVKTLCEGLIKDSIEWNDNEEVINMIFETAKESIIYIANNIMKKYINISNNNTISEELIKLLENCKGGSNNNVDKIEKKKLIENIFIKIIEI